MTPIILTVLLGISALGPGYMGFMSAAAEDLDKTSGTWRRRLELTIPENTKPNPPSSSPGKPSSGPHI